MTIHLVYKHNNALNENGKAIPISIKFESVDSTSSMTSSVGKANEISTNPVLPTEVIIPKKKPFANLNDILDGRLEVQAKITELRLLNELSLNNMGGSNAEIEGLKARLEEQKNAGVENSLAELKDLILGLAEGEEGAEGGGMEKLVTEAIMNRVMAPGAPVKQEEVFNPNVKQT